ncbi:MAG TPA: hypothetical protein VKF62_03390, partial [Planctomycetota bacterium]|nr:hypothetical protein [Planctomycetota bacterium]
HFALPADPFPTLPGQDLRFDVVVDFPNPAGIGVHRVDRFVNPVLGNLNLADLTDRQIDVFRSGRVRINGCTLTPVPPASPTLATTTGGLVLPAATTPPPLPVLSPTPDRFVGLDFDTLAATAPFRVKELLVDGQLDAAVACGAESFNVVLWDVTDPVAPFRRASASFATSTRNRRTFFPVSWILEPQRHYRLLARTTQRRAKTIAAPIAQGPVTVLGGLDFADADPCTGAAAAGATVDATKAYVAFRFAPDLGTGWVDLGGGLAGAAGIPVLGVAGSVSPGGAFTLTVTGGAVTAPAVLVAGLSSGCVPIFGGASVPALDFCILGLRTDEQGVLVQDLSWPAGWPLDLSLLLQCWVVDPSAPQGVAATNAIAGTLQP